MSQLYRSDVKLESIHEFDATKGMASAGLLPPDGRTQAVDEGHYIAFFSEDTEFCEAVNERLDAQECGRVGAMRKTLRMQGWRDEEMEEEGMLTHLRGLTFLTLANRALVFKRWVPVSS